MLIRERRDEDLSVCVELLRAVHEQAGYPVNWPADPGLWLTPEAALGCWVAVDGERVVGHVVLTGVDEPAGVGMGGDERAGVELGGDERAGVGMGGARRAEVERLFVDPAATGRGTGRQLLDHCVTVAAGLGRELSLEVVDNRGAAERLYRRAGWTETGRTPIDWGGVHATELIRFSAPGSRA
ncbi:GNAT superfamily N-acetyltransferase [Kribbella aluminosa]|uniref:GNAT superfamily N-acetyltransferase n=1 Tax=Kribbella aluminosa TaxID=416017 RepID=A0ABS4UDU3_9ACTN|nr:GNAT family N-acetyltransferase [Kribbella aluminosa]MBP2349793.1 GNAT superfamily N-acetyltransferase [Kribbella aluminosa]